MATQVEGIKWVPGTRFMVDGFAFTNAKCSHYFLTHYHSDHTVGLGRRFTAGTIYCSPVTAKLLAAERGLRAPTVQQLPLNQPVVIDGVTVTALDANHCPGAVMLLFEVPTGQGSVTRVLHTGDCRWQARLYTGSCLAHKRVDTLMLDTTYALPRHTFPPQAEAVSSMVQLMHEALQEEPDTLLVVSSYHIGKERAYLGVAAALGLKVYVPAAKLRVLQLLDLPGELMGVVTSDPCAQLHVGCTSLAPEELEAYLTKQQQQGDRSWARIMGFRATGWSYKRSGGLQVWRPSAAVALVGVPYSEHSSWHELRQCVAQLRPKRLVPTVNAATRSEQQALVDRFADLMDLSRDRSRLDFYLLPAPAAGAAVAAAASSSATGAAGAASASDPSALAAELRGAGGVQLGEPCAVAKLDGACAAGPSGASSSCTLAALDTAPSQGGPQQEQQQQQAEEGGEVLFDIGDVDMKEQQRLLEDAERRQKLRRSLEAAASAKKQQQQARRAVRGRPPAALQGVGKRAATLKKGAERR